MSTGLQRPLASMELLDAVDAASESRIPHALRAVVRFGLVDLTFSSTAIPRLSSDGAVPMLAFLAGMVWAIPIDHVLIRWLPRSGHTPGLSPACAVGHALDHSDEARWRLIGRIERAVL